VLIAVFQLLLATAACYGLWRLFVWSAAAMPPLAKRIVAAGFLIRALAGQALFWISWLRLPIARSLQIGDGIWLFIDGWWYMSYARHLMHEGVVATLTLTDARYPSRVFVQILTTCVALFGDMASVAIFLNCAAYLATCAILFRLRPRGNGALLFALAAVAFGPGMIIWSLQPLKDTVFLLFIAALVYVCALWQERPRLSLAVAIVALAYALSSIRWYFGMVVWLALGVFFVVTALRTQRRAVLIAAAVLLFAVIAQAVRLGGQEDIPIGIREILDPRPRIAALWRPSKATQTVTNIRGGFERTAGATSIKPGRALQPAPAPVLVAKKSAPIAKRAPAPPPIVEPEPVPTTAAPALATAAPAPAPPVPEPSTPVPAPEPEKPAPVAAPTPTPETPAPIAKPKSAPVPAPAPATPQPAPAPVPVPEKPAPISALAPEPEKPAPITITTPPPAPAKPKPAPEHRRAKPAPVTTTTVHPPPVTQSQPTPPPPPPARVPLRRPPEPAAPSFAARMISGVAAAFLPRVLGQALGLVSIGGGRGLWAFAELDTVAFDAVLLFAIVYIARTRPRITPLFVLVLLVFLGNAGPLIYTVTNFGTLFRLREMLYFLAALVPLTLAPRTPSSPAS
jgi:hypothetical protein